MERPVTSSYLDLVNDHWLVSKVDNWLWYSEGQRPQPCPIASDKNESLHAVPCRLVWETCTPSRKPSTGQILCS